jgi:hypothetical protein
VDDDVVMEPADTDEVVGVVATVVGSVPDVMDLEPVTAVTSSDCAASVSPDHKPAYRRWDCFGVVCGDHRFAVFDTDELDRAGTERFFEHSRSHPGSELDFDTCFATGGSGAVEVGKQDNRWAAALGVSICTVVVEGVVTDRGERQGVSV